MAGGRPALCRMTSPRPSASSALAMESVRVSCQTMALWNGRPVRRSQTIAVSRWLVTPMASRSEVARPAWPQGAADDGLGAVPDLERVVLDPAGAGEQLLVLELVPGDRPPVVVEDDEPRARRALVDRADEVTHAAQPRGAPAESPDRRRTRPRRCGQGHAASPCRMPRARARMDASRRAKETSVQFGRSYEEFEVGATYKHWPGKTVTEYDDHLFCLLTMNHHPLHLDSNYAEETTQFGKNVVVGNYVYSILLGMSVPDVSRQGDRQPRDRVPAPRRADLPRRHPLRRDHRARQVGEHEQGRPRRRARRDHRLQPGRHGRVHLPPQGDGAEGQLPRGARRRAARPPDAGAGPELARACGARPPDRGPSGVSPASPGTGGPARSRSPRRPPG